MITNGAMQSFSKRAPRLPRSGLPRPVAVGLAVLPDAGCCFATGIKEADNSLRFMGPIVPHVCSSHMFPLPRPPGNTTSQGLWELKKTLAGTHPRGAASPAPGWRLGMRGDPGTAPGRVVLGTFSATVFSGAATPACPLSMAPVELRLLEARTHLLSAH